MAPRAGSRLAALAAALSSPAVAREVHLRNTNLHKHKHTDHLKVVREANPFLTEPEFLAKLSDDDVEKMAAKAADPFLDSSSPWMTGGSDPATNTSDQANSTVALHRSGASLPDGPAPRRVYIDLGANWANTLRLYEDISEKTWLHGGPWEVYAFEASPFIQPYLEDFVNFLNGDGPQPALKVPPSGSSDHLNRYAPKYGCPVAPPWPEMRECMFERFKEQLHALKPDALLGDRSLVDRRLQAASRVPSSTRFVHLPAAAGNKDGKLDLGMMVPEQMIRGGALSRKIAGYPSANVNMVDVVTWLMKSFRKEDYVVVKMDVEGAEFPILTSLLDKNGGCLVDVLAMECHGEYGDCDSLLDKLRSTKCMKLLLEPHDYRAFDKHSTPDLYFPVDPRL